MQQQQSIYDTFGRSRLTKDTEPPPCSCAVVL